MRIVFLLVFFISSVSGQDYSWPTKLSGLYESMEDVPFLNENNKFSNDFNTKNFQKLYRQVTADENAIIHYEYSEFDVECDAIDTYMVSLYVYKDSVKYAKPVRNLGCTRQLKK